MKPYLITTFLSFLFIASYAQQADSLVSTKLSDDKIYTIADQDPTYPGGVNMFYYNLSLRVHYPEEAIKNKTGGVVRVTFVVEKDGNLTNIKVLKGISPEIDDEAIWLIYSSPGWVPGLKNNKPVRVQYNLALSFKVPPIIVNKRKQPIISRGDPLAKDSSIFSSVDNNPYVIGGMGKLYSYLIQNIHYPQSGIKNHIQGKVYTTFVVEKDGSLSAISIQKGLSRDINEEAIRLLSECPKWQPGIYKGYPERVTYHMPITFELPKSNAD